MFAFFGYLAIFLALLLICEGLVKLSLVIVRAINAHDHEWTADIEHNHRFLEALEEMTRPKPPFPISGDQLVSMNDW